MGENWSWGDGSKRKLSEESLYDHPDIGCEFSKGKPCLECPFQECWEVIGRQQFREDNKIELIKRGRPRLKR